MSDLPVAMSRLSNGLRVASLPLDHLRTAAVGVWLRVGTRDETPEQAGIAHLLEHMAFKGTERRSARRIAEEIEGVGGSLDAHTAREHTAYYARILAEDLPLAVDLLADILLYSRLDEAELAREREVVLQEIAEAADTPNDLVFDLFQEAAFPGQGLGWPILGREETVAGLDRTALRRFLEAHYRPERMVVAAAGRVDHRELVELVEERFAALEPAPQRPEPAPARYVGGEVRVCRDIDQVHLVLGLEGVSLHDREFYVQHVFASILGGGAASRLFQEVRENRGLAYSVFAYPQAFAETGLLGLYAATEPARASELLDVMLDCLRRLALEGPSEEELQRARKQVEASFLMALESPGAAADDLARQLLTYGRRIGLDALMAAIAAVDTERVRRFGARMLKRGRPTLAVVGPKADLPDLAAITARLSA